MAEEKLDLILRKISELEDQIIRNRQAVITANQILLTSGLSELSENLGKITAGEIVVGNNNAFGKEFTGLRLGYPSFQYGGNLYHLAGINADNLQFGVNAEDGTLVAGGGAVILDSDGIRIYDPSNNLVALGGDEGWEFRGRFRIRASSNITLAASSKTTLEFDTVDYDDLSALDLNTYPSRITVPTGYGGVYLVGLGLTAAPSAQTLTYYLLKNEESIGTERNGIAFYSQIWGSQSPDNTYIEGYSLVGLDEGDYIAVEVDRSAQTGTRDLLAIGEAADLDEVSYSPYLFAHRISPYPA